MSTVEIAHRRFVSSYVVQEKIDGPLPVTIGQDDLPMIVRLYKQIQTRSPIDDSVTVFEDNLVDSKAFLLNYSDVKLLSSRTVYTEILTDALSGIGVPQVEQPAIIQKVFRLIDETAVPEQHVDVCISDITEYYSANNISAAGVDLDDYESILIDTVTRESMETFRARLRPATKSSIEGLEKLRLLDHSLELQAIIEQTPSCPICMEPLDCLDAAAPEEEEEEEEGAIPTAKGKSQEDEARPKQKRKREEEETRPKKRRTNEEARPQDERNYEEDKEEEEEAIPQQIRKSKTKKAVVDDHPRMIMITRLPCLHHYHGDCIVHWLEINHVCPMCRYPMPIAETA